MDESGFALRDSQTTRALVNVRENTSWKVINGRQEWITAIECTSASGVTLPPLLIFNAMHTNTAWIPRETPSDWRFSTSTSGWTSDSHGYEWLTTVFEPTTRPTEPDSRRLLIMDGHSSHITANVIAFCMEHAIDLLILPPHTSHMLQPLDVSMFQPLKRALATETDFAARLDSGRIPRTEWTSMYIRAREKAFTRANILSGWRATGLQPLSPIVVLDRLATSPTPESKAPRTPGQSMRLDTSLLNSSPPTGTEVREANVVLHSELQKGGAIASPTRRYIERAVHALEATQSELAILRKRLSDQQELLQTRKKRKKGKRVALQGKFVFTTSEVLEIARQAEQPKMKEKACRRSQNKATVLAVEEDKENGLESVSNDSDSDCIIVAGSRAL